MKCHQKYSIKALWVWDGFGSGAGCFYPDPWQADNVFLVSFAALCDASWVVRVVTLLVILGSREPFYSPWPWQGSTPFTLMQANFKSDQSTSCPRTQGLQRAFVADLIFFGWSCNLMEARTLQLRFPYNKEQRDT